MAGREGLRHGSLFSGIGGFDLASSWMGWRNVFHCENDKFCRRILKYYWPEAKGYGDIKKFDATCYRGLIDVLTGGFPCQPFSAAGRRKGTGDDRFLWPEMCRVIMEIQPDWVVGENVLGLLNWRRGMAFEGVQADLEAAGYKVWPYILPAAGVGAPHLRYRVWFVAHTRREFGNWREGSKNDSFNNREGSGRQQTANVIGRLRPEEPVADANGEQRFQRRMHPPESEEAARLTSTRNAWDPWNPWENFPTQPAICGRDDGVSARLDRITFSEWRRRSIAGYGNAIVPQVALRIFRTIEETDRHFLKKV